MSGKVRAEKKLKTEVIKYSCKIADEWRESGQLESLETKVHKSSKIKNNKNFK